MSEKMSTLEKLKEIQRNLGIEVEENLTPLETSRRITYSLVSMYGQLKNEYNEYKSQSVPISELEKLEKKIKKVADKTLKLEDEDKDKSWISYLFPTDPISIAIKETNKQLVADVLIACAKQLQALITKYKEGK